MQDQALGWEQPMRKSTSFKHLSQMLLLTRANARIGISIAIEMREREQPLRNRYPTLFNAFSAGNYSSA